MPAKAKSTKAEVFYIKAEVPYRYTDNPNIPYRVIALLPNTDLYSLGMLVLNAFEFDDDHPFSFLNNVKRHSKSTISYELPEMMFDLQPIFGEDRGLQELDMTKFTVKDLFTRKGKKWLMLFDFGDEWEFTLTLTDRRPVEQEKKYPHIAELKYDPPVQYLNDEW